MGRLCRQGLGLAGLGQHREGLPRTAWLGGVLGQSRGSCSHVPGSVEGRGLRRSQRPPGHRQGKHSRRQALYSTIKEWGPNPENYSFSVGEVGKPGQLVPERYLDDRSNLKGTRLKMLCRMGCLPLMESAARRAPLTTRVPDL